MDFFKIKTYLNFSLLIFLGFYVSRMKSGTDVELEDRKLVQKVCFVEMHDIEKKVRGNSLSGIIEDNQDIKVHNGYYACNDPKRGDIAMLNYAGNENPIIKIIKGLPGDKIELEKKSDKFLVKINGEVLKNSQKIPYQFSEKKVSLISLYIKDYHGIIPNDSYFLLGNLMNGSVDSTQFGYVQKKDLIGKVEID